ncbi:TRAP transporter substrate-binding protein [Anaerotruncus rubiinfantis]|uniref:TRAP transporter substrate-binding protein n=1 Tax=Anaerotruncus rubiinfantis TaxID=1720200 RepID=UPI001897560F|nr:TRAP transporter substrate-binding protein [Anaerotruncus rubiinfantis]
MKKRIVALLLSGLTLALLVACGNNNQPAASDSTASSPETAGSGEVYELSLGHIQNPGHDLYIAIENFAKAMEEQSNGKVKITVYPSSQLGTEREMIEQCIMGTLDITHSDPAGWSTGLSLPEVGVFGLPFLYDGLESQKALIEEVALEELQNRMIPKGVHPFLIYSNGIRHTICKTKPINTMEDLSGLKMRCPENPLFVDTWNLLKCQSVTMPWGEVYTGLSQGVADAAEADAVGIVNTNLQEVGKYYSRTAHMGGLFIISMNVDKWNSLPADIQQLFVKVATESSEMQIKNRKTSDDAAEKAIADAGVQINDVSAEECQKMREAVQPMYDEYIEQYNMEDLVKRMMEVVG